MIRLGNLEMDIDKPAQQIIFYDKLISKIINNSASGIALVDQNGEILESNKSLQNLLGYKKEELNGKRFVDITHPKDVQNDWELAQELFQGKRESYTINKRYIRKDGKVIWCRLTGSFFWEFYNKPLFIGSVVDINKQKMMQRQIFQLKKRLNLISDGSNNIIVSFDASGNIISWNKTMENITGFKRRELKEKNIFEQDVFGNSEQIHDFIHKIKNCKRSQIKTFFVKSKKNQKKLIRGSFSAIKNDENKISEIFFIGKDVTAEIKNHGRLVLGESYFISGEKGRHNNGIDIFYDLIQTGYEGFCITRCNVNQLNNEILADDDISMYVLDTRNCSDSESLTRLISYIHLHCIGNKNVIVYLDRIDYLINRFSFKDFINLLYRLNDIIIETGSVLLVNLNSCVMSESQLAMVSEELKPLPRKSLEKVKLDDKLYSLLSFIFKENKENRTVTYTRIRKKFSIVNYTVAKRVKELEDMNLLYIVKKGRAKALYVTDKGKRTVQ